MTHEWACPFLGAPTESQSPHLQETPFVELRTGFREGLNKVCREQARSHHCLILWERACSRRMSSVLVQSFPRVDDSRAMHIGIRVVPVVTSTRARPARRAVRLQLPSPLAYPRGHEGEGLGGEGAIAQPINRDSSNANAQARCRTTAISRASSRQRGVARMAGNTCSGSSTRLHMSRCSLFMKRASITLRMKVCNGA
jgi:hypothetical protein